MMKYFLFLLSVVSIAAAQSGATAQTAAPAQTAAQTAIAPAVSTSPLSPAVVAAPHDPVIRFEDATDKAGIDFTHSFGSRQLGSLLEGTGAGCVWFDYNNSGLMSLYVVNGRPLDDTQGKARNAAAQSSLSQQREWTFYRRDGEGRAQSGYVWDGRGCGRLRQRRP
jgi:hypothetical protein